MFFNLYLCYSLHQLPFLITCLPLPAIPPHLTATTCRLPPATVPVPADGMSQEGEQPPVEGDILAAEKEGGGSVVMGKAYEYMQ